MIRVRNVIGFAHSQLSGKLPDLNIRLESCDASSPQATGALVTSIARPIAGCMLLSVTLSDCPFTSYTAESYGIPFPSKKEAFEALRAIVPLEKLDLSYHPFFSGRTRECRSDQLCEARIFSFNPMAIDCNTFFSVLTHIDELARPYANAFLLIAPAIIDTSTIANAEVLSTDMRLKHGASWAMSSSRKCPSSLELPLS